jgi:integrase/recombinase XerD
MPGRPGHPLARHASDLLTDLSNANGSAHTLRAYRGDLLQFCAHHDSEVGELTAATVRAYLADIAGLAASSRTSGLRSFCRWAVRHDLLAANPMDRIDNIKVPRSLPRPAAAADVAKVLAVICTRRPRKDIAGGRGIRLVAARPGRQRRRPRSHTPQWTHHPMRRPGAAPGWGC